MFSVTSEAKNNLSVRLKNWSKLLPHALLTAMIMFTLDHLGWLDWLERATIELSAATSSVMPRLSWRAPLESASTYDDSAPRTILIDEESFQGRFRERTPLDRAQLTGILSTILAASPRLLAIDIDLSPLAGASEVEGAAQDRLDELLTHAAGTTPVILVTPFPTSLPERARSNARWMRKLCTKGQRLAFAYSYVARNQGVVTKIHPSFPSLGNAVYARSKVTSSTASDKGACKDLKDGPDNAGYPPYLDAMFVHIVTEPLRERDALVPMNVNFFEERLSSRLSYTVRDMAPDQMKDHVIFLGTDIQTMDSLITASGAQPGVLVHAATFFTRMHPIAPAPHWLLFIVETVIGMLLLRAFIALWLRYHHDIDVPPSSRTLASQAYAVVLASRWSAGVIALAALVSVFSVALSGFLLAQATWFNFAPIAISAAVKAKQTAAEAEAFALKEKLAGLGPQHVLRSRSRLKRFGAILVTHFWLTALALLALILIVVH